MCRGSHDEVPGRQPKLCSLLATQLGALSLTGKGTFLSVTNHFMVKI